MIQYIFKNAKHCVVNNLHFKNFPVDSISHADPLDLGCCMEARPNTLVAKLWYLYKHSMQIFN
jgi:hypothetical protein